MTIKKGEDWGSRGALERDAPVVASDRALAALFRVSKSGLVGPRQVGLVGGDLAATMGVRASEKELRSSERTLLPIDLATVDTGDMVVVMAASLVIRSRFWAGEIRSVMNASYLGEWNVSPAGHPNDGRLDVIEAQLGLSDRLKARKRLPAGAHVPHPSISIRRLKSVSWPVEGAQRVTIDGEQFPGVRSVSVQVCPDATVVAI